MTYDWRSQKRGPYSRWGEYGRHDMPRTPGEALRQFRRLLGYTQAEFCERVPGLNRSTLAMYETDRRDIYSELITTLKDRFPVHADALLLKGSGFGTCRVVDPDELSHIDV